VLSFKLDCGRSVSVVAFYSQPTFLNLMLGLSNRHINDDIISKCLTEMTPLWGRRKVHMVPPRIDQSDPNHPTLPPVRYTAWLTCYEPISKENHGSELVVVWFREECSEDEPFRKILHDGIRSLPWDELAEDFVC
jgi:hypothetical protein